MKIALVHDDLVQWGGAERMLLGLSELFPQAPIYTSVFDDRSQFLAEKFKGKKIITSFIQKIPGWRKLYRTLLPLYPIAFETFDFDGFDIVLTQATRFAKSVITKPETKHVCYCHTPPRFLWRYSSVKNRDLIDFILSPIRLYDQVASQRVDVWVAGSKNAQKRIKQIYKADSTVIYPFVDFKAYPTSPQSEQGYLLVISRLNSYKKVDLAVRAAIISNTPIKVVGTGPEELSLRNIIHESRTNLVEMLGNVSETKLAELIARCKALIVVAEEDFGLSALEAQFFGKPVIAYQQGGSSETVLDGQTGILFKRQSVEDLVEAIHRLDKITINSTKCVEYASFFSRERFNEEFRNLIESLT